MINLTHLRNLNRFELSGKLFARKNRVINEVVFIYFDNAINNHLLGSDGLKYHFDGSCLDNTFEIIAEVCNYGRLE